MDHSDPADPLTREHHWDAVYAAKSATDVSWYQSDPDLSLSMIQASGVPPDANIIDIGGGASTLADHLLSNGYHAITVLDVAATALEQAKHRLGHAAAGINWLVADVVAWHPSTQYSLWHDRAVFHFLTNPDDRRAYLTTLRQALLPGGTVVLATFALDGPESCSGLPVQRFSPETIASELGTEFTLLQTTYEDHITPAGTLQRFIYCRFTY